MAHDSVINALINVGLHQKELQNVLASNVVLDWFGRTLSGKQRVVDFYLNSNNAYEHHLTNTETVQTIEDRVTHMKTLEEPEENFEKSIELSSDEQWYDCEANTSIDLKESQRTPPQKSTINMNCPPAPYRRTLIIDSSDEEDSDSEDEMELGVYPLDLSLDSLMPKKSKEKIDLNVKRQRLNEDSYDEANICEQKTLEKESKYSDLYYLESTGSVTMHRQVSSSASQIDDSKRRECKVFISYRINKSNHNDIQIALIIYKPNNSNQKTRRNLLNEFSDEVVTDLSLTPSLGRFSTAVKEHPNKPENMSDVIATAPTGNKSIKGTKRPMMSRSRLRF